MFSETMKISIRFENLWILKIQHPEGVVFSRFSKFQLYFNYPYILDILHPEDVTFWEIHQIWIRTQRSLNPQYPTSSGCDVYGNSKISIRFEKSLNPQNPISWGCGVFKVFKIFTSTILKSLISYILGMWRFGRFTKSG